MYSGLICLPKKYMSGKKTMPPGNQEENKKYIRCMRYFNDYILTIAAKSRFQSLFELSMLSAAMCVIFPWAQLTYGRDGIMPNGSLSKWVDEYIDCMCV